MASVNIPIPNLPVNWKTSLIGLVSGVLAWTVMYLQSGNVLDWKAWAIGAVLTIQGLVQKDFNVSGGTVPQPSSAEVKAEITTAPTFTQEPPK